MFSGGVVIDTGGLYTRMGVCGEDSPDVMLKTVINGETNEVGTESNGGNDIKPIAEGTVTAIDALRRIWDHGISLVEASDTNTTFETVVLSAKPHTTADEQHQIVEYFLEELGMYIESEGVLSLYSIGKTNGVMVHSGETCTHIASMFDGLYSAKPICLPTITTGQQFTENMKSLLPQLTIDEIRNIKLRCGLETQGSEFELPDGNKIFLQENVTQIANQIFAKDRLHHVIDDYIQQSDEFVQEYLYGNIMLVGGNTMWKGFGDKLRSELQIIEPRSLFTHPSRVRVVSAPERMNAVWIGGSIVGSLSAYYGAFLTKEEYEEVGSMRFVRSMELKLQGL